MISPIQKPSPNFSLGRNGYQPEIIILHTASGTLVGTDYWFSQPTTQVSAHYIVGLNGEIHQYCGDGDTAWHAGVVLNPNFALYKPNVNPNLYSLGIETEGTNLAGAPESQLSALVELVRTLAIRWSIPIDRNHILGHYQIKSSKPNCPAIDKSIIDTIVARAKVASPPDKAAIKAQIISLLNQI